MKKLIYIPAAIGVLAFGGIVFANTDANPAPAPQQGTVTNNVEAQKTNAQTEGQKEFITFDEVSEKALAIANGTITDIELDADDRRPHYEVDVYHDSYEYDIKFDAVTGEVLEQKRDRDDDDDFDDRSANSSNAADNLISSDEAVKAALAEASGNVEKVELDSDDGITYYEVEIENGRTDSEVYVNAVDGSILKVETDDDNDDD